MLSKSKVTEFYYMNDDFCHLYFIQPSLFPQSCLARNPGQLHNHSCMEATTFYQKFPNAYTLNTNAIHFIEVLVNFTL